VLLQVILSASRNNAPKTAPEPPFFCTNSTHTDTHMVEGQDGKYIACRN
jgi:hypothetical protein